MELSKTKVEELLAKYQRAKAALSNVSEKAEATIDCVKQGAEGVGSAFAFGYVNGRWGGQEGVARIMGAPADLVIGGLGFAAALMGFGGKYDEDILNLSVGALCSPALREGYKQGANAQAKASQQIASGAARANTYNTGAANANAYAPGAAGANQYAPGAAAANAYQGG